MAQARLEYLYKRCISGAATPEEQQEMVNLLTLPENEDLARQLLHRAYHEPKETTDLPAETAASILQAIAIAGEKNTGFGKPMPANRVYSLRNRWWVAAAFMLILAGTAALVWINRPKQEHPVMQPAVSKNDVAPGGNKAILTLGNGATIILDSAHNGMLAEQGNSRVSKLTNGQLAYQLSNEKPAAVLYNTLTTPRGGQYQLLLPDGSQVWLNAASSITYPTAFTGNTREVSIRGEVYFEVVKNRQKPFIVRSSRDTITVLGTRFNVNSYADEPAGKTTLLEGSVRISNKVLQPGEAYSSGKVMKTDVQQDVSWVNGAFNFNNMDLKSIFRQLSRWYDVEIVYPTVLPDKVIRGKMGRDLNLSEVLSIFQGMGLHCRIQNGNKLAVLQN